MNRVIDLFQIQYPIIQGGMVWNSEYELASAVSNAGGLGLLASGSMYPEQLREQLRKCKQATSKPFGVNLPLIYPNVKEHAQIIVEQKVPIVFTSAGNPSDWTSYFKKHQIKVVHVVSSLKFALKAQEAGVDAIVAEGFEAGGHNGREENTTLTLLSLLKSKISLPIIAAGGIATGKAMHAVMVLGAEGVQMGTRFAMTTESKSHKNFKNCLVGLQEGQTMLTLKELAPVRMITNGFYQQIIKAYQNHASVEELKNLKGKGKAKEGMYLGDIENGELEIGQIAALLTDIKSAKEVIDSIVSEFENSLKESIDWQ